MEHEGGLLLWHFGGSCYWRNIYSLFARSRVSSEFNYWYAMSLFCFCFFGGLFCFLGGILDFETENHLLNQQSKSDHEDLD